MYKITYYANWWNGKEWIQIKKSDIGVLTDIIENGNTLYFMHNVDIVWCLEKQDIIKLEFLKHLLPGSYPEQNTNLVKVYNGYRK